MTNTIDTDISFITCSCGQEFQVLNADGTDWDENATAQAYDAHLPSCPNK